MPEESKFISLQLASGFCDYSQEYLSLRARQGKLKSVKFGRNWVTTREWLDEYLKEFNGSGCNARFLAAERHERRLVDNFIREKRILPLPEKFVITRETGDDNFAANEVSSSRSGKNFFRLENVIALSVFLVFSAGIIFSLNQTKEISLGTLRSAPTVQNGSANIFQASTSFFSNCAEWLSENIKEIFLDTVPQKIR